MKDMSRFLICTDYDGTFSIRGEVPAGNCEAVREFQRAGGLFTVASGRTPDFILSKKDSFIPNAPLISINGTMINDPYDMHVIKEFPLGDEVTDAVIDIFDHTETMRLAVYGADREGKWWQRGNGTAKDYIESVPRPWYKILFIQPADVTPAVLAKCMEMYGDRYEFDRSWPEGIELHGKDTGKGQCLKYIREMYPDRELTIVGVGDYENDISLIRMADIGYAVANATEPVKAAADRITVSNTENAIAAVIAELEQMA